MEAFSSQLIMRSEMGSLYWVQAALVGSLVFVLRIVTIIWWKPLQMKQCFQPQGVSVQTISWRRCRYG